MSGELVLVTGGSGFLGAHCIVRLLNDGFRVRTTVRSLKREPEVRDMVRAGGAEAGERLGFAETDLLSDKGWAEAAAGCAYVMHVASPFPQDEPKDEDELIRPAREGTLRVLRAARDAGARRVVLVSSFAAIGYGHPDQPQPFDEASWTNVDGPGISAYAKSKTLAERAAWDFVGREGGGLELSVVNPVGIFGPALASDYSTSIGLVRQLLERAVPAMPRIRFGVVDVRDVAELCVRAMTSPSAKGERFLAVSGDFLTAGAIARILKDGMGTAGARVPTREIPDWLMRLLGLALPMARAAVPELGKMKNGSNAKARKLLGWQPRSAEEAVLASARSLVELGVVRG